MVIIGKACNFILFCLTSHHFRARLITLTQRKVNKQFTKLSASFRDVGENIRRAGTLRRNRMPLQEIKYKKNSNDWRKSSEPLHSPNICYYTKIDSGRRSTSFAKEIIFSDKHFTLENSIVDE